MRVALFTPFSPETGGGAAQLRSHLRFLPGLLVTWFYLAAQPALNAPSDWKWLGPRLTPAELLRDAAARAGALPFFSNRVRQLVSQMQADLYWVVGHYEGLSIAAELQAQGKLLHLTIHDDPFGTWIRSDLYKWFRPLLARAFPRILRSAKSVDVTSWGMRNLYREKYGVNCFSLYLHVPELPQLAANPDPASFTIGHIGTLYHSEPFRRFLTASFQFAKQSNRTLRFIRIGTSPQLDAFAAANPAAFESYADLSEEAALPLLAQCDLLYAMYPPGKIYELFRRTSLPIKLSSYVQAQRPVFAHSPSDSTLARIIRPYRVGRVCESTAENEIQKEIVETLSAPVPREHFEALRRDLMGFTQLQQLHAALSGHDWTRFPEFDFPAG